jgi:hypothetical protein
VLELDLAALQEELKEATPLNARLNSALAAQARKEKVVAGLREKVSAAVAVAADAEAALQAAQTELALATSSVTTLTALLATGTSGASGVEPPAPGTTAAVLAGILTGMRTGIMNDLERRLAGSLEAHVQAMAAAVAEEEGGTLPGDPAGPAIPAAELGAPSWGPGQDGAAGAGARPAKQPRRARVLAPGPGGAAALGEGDVPMLEDAPVPEL